ncbi:MAG: D-cysteine desulfhydrase family protein [Myxococcota bacterium]|nr:D-cysteine desulfhydrase family protein [Myxococcota bacterium]
MTKRSRETLRSRMAAFPRTPLAHLPTPLEKASGLTRMLGGPEIWLKRDDCTGLALGGNKTRKLEFLMGEAVATGADSVLTFGALQSNHARQTAAAAGRLGLTCHLILVSEMGPREDDWYQSGNLLLDELLGAHVHPVRSEEEAAKQAVALLEEAREKNQSLYVIPVGGSNSVGELGYVNCVLELEEQLESESLKPSVLFHASSSLGTHSGLALGLHALSSTMRPKGIIVADSSTPAEQLAEIQEHTNALAEKLELEGPITDPDQLDGRQLGEGYGVVTEAALEAISLVARSEGLLLDPVYTGKAMAGLIEAIRSGEVSSDEKVLFLHTGGAPGLFAYRETLGSGQPIR